MRRIIDARRKEEDVPLVPKEIKADPLPDVSTKPPQKRTCVRVSVVLSYCAIWTWFLILVHYSKSVVGGGDDKSQQLAVLCSTIFIIVVEIIKNFSNCLLYLQEDPRNTPKDLWRSIFSAKMKPLMVKYLPIAILYAIYNNLMFLNLRSNNPVTYQVISSSRLILTTAVWQMSFKGETILPARKLAILVIFLGILSKNLSSRGSVEADSSAAEESANVSVAYYEYLGKTMLMVLQMSCSVLASIYNEMLLKNEDFGSQFIQNIALTFNSMALNAFIGSVEIIRLSWRGIEINVWDVSVKRLMTPSSIATIMTLAAVGIMSSAMLRYENSITKGVTSAMVTILATIIEYLCFEHVFVPLEMLGIFLVCSGTVLYFVASSPPS